MKKEEINIRDPYVLVQDNKYYMYGTRAATCWGKADGFDVYVSEDLEEWSGPVEIFKRPEGFWADQNFWAPECIFYAGSFYLITTFGNGSRKGIQILKAYQPEGPFVPLTEDVVTPKDWTCIDGTVYMDSQGTPYLIFSHSFEDVPDGDMCMIELSRDLTRAVGDPAVLFSTKDAPWAKPMPFAKEEFHMDGDVYFTDGPAVYTTGDHRLIVIWSSWGDHGYSVGMAVSDSGDIKGPWRHLEKPLFPENGGHGMMFTDLHGEARYVFHYPNDFYKERPHFYRLKEAGDGLELE